VLANKSSSKEVLVSFDINILEIF